MPRKKRGARVTSEAAAALETLWNEVTRLYGMRDEGYLDADLDMTVPPGEVDDEEFEGVDGGELKRTRAAARAFLKATDGRARARAPRGAAARPAGRRR